jgi:hypothetical protein
MLNCRATAIWMIALAAGLAACHHGRPHEMSQPPSGVTMSKLQSLLEVPAPGRLLPELASASSDDLARSPVGASVLAWARQAAAAATIPETTYTLYRRFRLTGERAPYEGPYFEKRGSLTRETLAVWLGQDDARIDRVNDLLWSICEETTWVLPAHEKSESTIDLFAAETGVELAQVLQLIGDRLPEEMRARVNAEIKRRILDRYLAHAREYRWNGGTNNWTGVCAGSVGETFLMLEPDVARQAKALALVIEQLNRFIRSAFEEDGGCLEGIGYWNYGLIHFVEFAEMLRERTAGAIDLLGQEKIKAIARYPLAVVLAKDTYASFADAEEHSSVRPFLAARLAQRAGADGLLGLTGGVEDWRLTSVLRNLLWWDGRQRDWPPLEDVFLPQSGVARIIGETAHKPLALAVKAGHNAEPHNHNDVGSFVLCIDGLIYLCDPGHGLYSADYFGPKRYENVFANSYGHSVPRIGGMLESPGRDRFGTIEKTGQRSVRICFHHAYEVPALREAVRTLSVVDGAVILDDAFVFDAPGLEVEEAFVTWQKVEVDGPLARVITDKGWLEIRADTGAFAAEHLEDACRKNHKPGVLTRVAVTCPAAANTHACFTMAFHPAV